MDNKEDYELAKFLQKIFKTKMKFKIAHKKSDLIKIL